MDEREFFGDWCEVIDFDILHKILASLGDFIQTNEISPAPENLFKVFGCCPYNKLGVIILGQDPYPQKGVGTGIAFGNHEGTPVYKYSPSLKVIYNAVQEYCTYDLPFSTIDKVFPTLERWCEQGVLMLNSALSIPIGHVGAHQSLWKPFTKSLLTNCQKKKKGVIFVLLGDVAGDYAQYLDKQYVIKCPHPSWCARTGNKLPNIFAEIDRMMLERGKELIYWI